MGMSWVSETRTTIPKPWNKYLQIQQTFVPRRGSNPLHLWRALRHSRSSIKRLNYFLRDFLTYDHPNRNVSCRLSPKEVFLHPPRKRVRNMLPIMIPKIMFVRECCQLVPFRPHPSPKCPDNTPYGVTPCLNNQLQKTPDNRSLSIKYT